SKKLKMSFTATPYIRSGRIGAKTPDDGSVSRWLLTGRPRSTATDLLRHLPGQRSQTRRHPGRGLLLLARRRRILDQLDIQAQRLELLEEDVERLGQTGLQHMLALDDRLVHPGAAQHVIRLDGEELLQGVGGAVRLHGPHLHLAEALAAELGLAAQRLLRHQRE